MPANLPDHLGGIATFVMAARSRSFTEAADKLGVSKSAVGKSVARLEQRLGVKLFHRSTRKLSLTADGEAYLAACSSALEEIESAEAAFTHGQRTPSGRLRVDMPVTFGRKRMLPLLARIARDHPALELTLTFTDHLIDPLEEGVDLVIRFGELPDSSDLVARRLTRQRLVICGSPDYLRRRGTPQRPEDLPGHACLVAHRRGQPLSWSLSDGDEVRRFMPPATHAIGDGDALIQAAVLGLGICQFPQALLEDHLADGSLVPLLDGYSRATVDVHLVWPRSSQLRPKVRYVVDTLMTLAEQGAFG